MCDGDRALAIQTEVYKRQKIKKEGRNLSGKWQVAGRGWQGGRSGPYQCRRKVQECYLYETIKIKLRRNQ